jgi:hypothetical protein
MKKIGKRNKKDEAIYEKPALRKVAFADSKEVGVAGVSSCVSCATCVSCAGCVCAC